VKIVAPYSIHSATDLRSRAPSIPYYVLMETDAGGCNFEPRSCRLLARPTATTIYNFSFSRANSCMFRPPLNIIITYTSYHIAFLHKKKLVPIHLHKFL